MKQWLRTWLFLAVNLPLRLVGLRLVTVHTPTRNFSEFFRHIKSCGFEFRSVIDVGVARGSPDLYSAFPSAAYYLVEAVPECGPALEKLRQKLGAQVFNVAAGAEDGELDFFVHPDISGSSRFRQWEGEFFDGSRRRVPVRRLDRLLPQTIQRPCLLKIDTQGAELEVLAGASALLPLIDMIIIEVSFHEFRKGAPEFNAIVTALDRLGYACYEVIDGHYRAYDNALAQVDLVFVKPESELRRHKAFFSKSQAYDYLGAEQTGGIPASNSDS